MAALNLGNISANQTVYFLWSTNAADGSSISIGVSGQLRVYKDDNVNFSVAGITSLEDFDSIIGIHSVAVDTSSDGFYATGSDYHVVIVDVGIDGIQEINAPIGYFSIENRA